MNRCFTHTVRSTRRALSVKTLLSYYRVKRKIVRGRRFFDQRSTRFPQLERRGQLTSRAKINKVVKAEPDDEPTFPSLVAGERVAVAVVGVRYDCDACLLAANRRH